jgi:hypothetical protein
MNESQPIPAFKPVVMGAVPFVMPKEFEAHRLNALGIARVQHARYGFAALLGLIEEMMVPEAAREFAIVRAKLEEAAMYANKAVSLDPRNQEKD